MWNFEFSTATETLAMLRQAYSDKAMGHTQCFEWHRRFKSRRTSLGDAEQSWRPAVSVNTTRKCGGKLISSCMMIIGEQSTILLMFLVCCWVRAGDPNVWIEHAACCCQLYPLPADHWTERTFCQNLCQHAADDPSFMTRIISRNESCVYRYEWLWEKVAVNTLEKPFISKEGTISVAQSRPCSLLFFFFFQYPRYCASRIHPPGPVPHSRVLLQHF